MSDKTEQLEELMLATFKKQEKQISALFNKVEALQAENIRLLSMKQNDASDPLCKNVESMLQRRVEWTIFNISKKRLDYPKGKSIWSEHFNAGGLKYAQLEFFPNGRESASLDDFCSLFFWCPAGVSVKYQLFVGGHYRAPDDDEYDCRMGHGHSNFCAMTPEVDYENDCVTVGVDILEVELLSVPTSKTKELRVLSKPLTEIISSKLDVIQNLNVNRIEWRIPSINKRLLSLPRGASIYSKVFTAAGIQDMILEFYPNGNANTTNTGFCALYLRCPEKTSVVITLFVGNFRKGPIAAKFEGPAGKGLPDFCKLSDQIDEHGGLIIGIEVQNTDLDDSYKRTTLVI